MRKCRSMRLLSNYPFWLKSAVHIDERIFSSVGMMILSKRNRLNDDILEASECLRSWFLRKLGEDFRVQMIY